MKPKTPNYQNQFNIFLVFSFVSLFIVLLHLLFHPIRVLGMDTSIFYMDEKYTLAAFFTSITAFLVGYKALTSLYLYPKQTELLKKTTNLIFGLFFIALSIDEYFEVHEYVNTIIKEVLQNRGLVFSLANFSWIFPLSVIIAGVFLVLIVKIRLSAPYVKKYLFLGSMSFLGVLVFELLGASSFGEDIYVHYVAIEEGLEMLGVTFFLYAVLIEEKNLKSEHCRSNFKVNNNA